MDHRDLPGGPARVVDESLVAGWMPRRPPDGHKGTFGKVLILGGSVGYTGAPVLAARGALRTGTGLVTVLTQPEAYPIVAAGCLEAMARPLPDGDGAVLELVQGSGGALIGPGLGQGPRAAGLVPLLLESAQGSLVVDADGINLLARHMDSLDRRPAGAPSSPPTRGSLPGWGERSRRTGWPAPGPLPQSTGACWCARGTGPSWPGRTGGVFSTPRATRAWPRGARGTCWAG